VLASHWGKADEKEKIRFKKIAKMTGTDHNSAVQLRSSQFSVTVILAIFLNRIHM
jgi:hypothetical protein